MEIIANISNTLHPTKHPATSCFSVDPDLMSATTPAIIPNLINGKWIVSEAFIPIIDPLNGQPFIKAFVPSAHDFKECVASMKKCPKSGLHNPIKNIERYVMYGEVCRKAAENLSKPEVLHFFTRLIQRVLPKSYDQAQGEVKVTKAFLANFSGDNVRYLANSYDSPGDRYGQKATSYRWPYGPVCIISPFNFPLEIPVLQLMGALFMGNKVLLKPNYQTSIVMEQFIRLLISCGMPPTDVEFVNMRGNDFEKLLKESEIRMTQFTGSSEVAEKLSKVLNGKIKVEDSGFDWKILGPDASPEYLNYIAWQCDQDCYAASGQKCSKQSLLMVHKNWANLNLYGELEKLAARRTQSDLTVGPLLSVTNSEIDEFIQKLLAIPGSKVLFGGKPLEGNTVPPCYGSYQPTAVFVPIQQMLNPHNFSLVTKEIFGPFQIITEFEDADLEGILALLEKISMHLTCGIVSNDIKFRTKVLGSTVNGTTYMGLRAKTTGAPQNHWFGPAGDPRCAGIGTKESILLVWSCHREVVTDEDAPTKAFIVPKAT